MTSPKREVQLVDAEARFGAARVSFAVPASAVGRQAIVVLDRDEPWIAPVRVARGENSA
jgi:hypothetical protein